MHFISNTKHNPRGNTANLDTRGSLRLYANPVWTHSFSNVALPVQLIFDHIPMSKSLIKGGYDCKAAKKIGGLMFARYAENIESKDSSLMITYGDEAPNSTVAAIKADVKMIKSRRELGKKGTKLHFKSPTAERRHASCVGGWRGSNPRRPAPMEQGMPALTSVNHQTSSVFHP